MAHIEEAARIPHFWLVRTDSYLDPPDSPWIMYQLRVLLRYRPPAVKRIYMLSWHAEEKRLAESSELRELRDVFPQLATWAKTQIAMHTIGD